MMGAPIFGTRYVLAPTPEGEEHPNVIDRFVKQEHFCDTHCVWTNHHSDCVIGRKKSERQMKHPRTMQEAFGPYTNDYIYDDDPPQPWLFWLVVGVTVLWAIFIVWLLVC